MNYHLYMNYVYDIGIFRMDIAVCYREVKCFRGKQTSGYYRSYTSGDQTNTEERQCSFQVSFQMCNAIGVLHGGALMSFCVPLAQMDVRGHGD